MIFSLHFEVTLQKQITGQRCAFRRLTRRLVYPRARPWFFIGAKTEEPKAESGGGVHGGGSMPLLHQLASMGERCELPSGVRGSSEPPTAQRFSTIFSTQGCSLSWHYNIVKCGLSCSHCGPRPSCLSLHTLLCLSLCTVHWMQMWILYRSLLANCCHFSNGVVALSVIYILYPWFKKVSRYISQCVLTFWN